MNSPGVGFGPAVIQHIVGKKSGSGIMPYLKGVVGAFWSFEPEPIRIVADGLDVSQSVMLEEITMGPTVGGGMIVSPGADPVDGLADICVIRKISTFTFLRYLPMALWGKHTHLPQVIMGRSAGFELRSEGVPIVVHTDGELRTSETGIVKIETHQQRLPVLCGG